MTKHGMNKSSLTSFRVHKAKEVIQKANKIEDLPTELGIDLGSHIPTTLNPKIVLKCGRCSDFTSNLIDEMFTLLQNNMQDLYEDSSWGWNSTKKKEEAFSSKSWILCCLLREELQNIGMETSVAGFVSFRFEREAEYPVLYCYEIHVHPNYRGLSLGRCMMRILESLAVSTKMNRVLLTVFKANKSAQQFFTKLGFSLDVTDPSLFKTVRKVDYMILSKLVN